MKILRKASSVAPIGFVFAVTVAVMAWFFAAAAHAAEKVALVIGNSAYSSVPLLQNPSRDAALIGDRLAAAGFEVTRLNDLTQIDLVRALQGFKASAATARVALVYYAGHGIEVNRVNYFVPVDAKLEADSDIAFEAVQLDFALSAVAQASELSVVIVDACRNNPFTMQMTRELGTRSVGRGLSAVEPSGNVLVAYAAKEGTVALDGDGGNSPYAQALAAALLAPDLEIGQLFRQVRDDVLKQTNGMQEPFTYGSLSSQAFFLNAALPDPDAQPKPASAPASPDANAESDLMELALWGLASATNGAEGYQEYLRQYPSGRFEFFAKQRLNEIQKQPGAAPAAAAEPLSVQPDPGVPLDLSRDQVVRVQETLTILGFDPGGRDGSFGPRTAKAVERFQASRNLPATGLLTADQLQALLASVTEDQLAALRRTAVTRQTKSQPATASAPKPADDKRYYLDGSRCFEREDRCHLYR